MSYLASGRIQVFPYGNDRGTADPYARILNEQNIRRIIRSIVDKDCYVINYDKLNNIIEFVLDGYYIKADFTGTLSLLDDNLWAQITLNNIRPEGSSEGVSYEYLSGGDVDSYFQGVSFSTSRPLPGVLPVDLKNPDKNYLYKGHIDVLNGVPYSSMDNLIHGFRELNGEPEITTLSYSNVSIPDSVLKLDGWGLVNGGQSGLFVSIDNTNWYHMYNGHYSNAGSNEQKAFEDVGATSIFLKHGRFQDVTFDLKSLNTTTDTITKDVFIGVGSLSSGAMGVIVKITGVRIPPYNEDIVKNGDTTYFQILQEGAVPASSYIRLNSNSVEGSQPEIIYCGTSTDVI